MSQSSVHIKEKEPQINVAALKKGKKPPPKCHQTKNSSTDNTIQQKSQKIWEIIQKYYILSFQNCWKEITFRNSAELLTFYHKSEKLTARAISKKSTHSEKNRIETSPKFTMIKRKREKRIQGTTENLIKEQQDGRKNFSTVRNLKRINPQKPLQNETKIVQ